MLKENIITGYVVLLENIQAWLSILLKQLELVLPICMYGFVVGAAAVSIKIVVYFHFRVCAIAHMLRCASQILAHIHEHTHIYSLVSHSLHLNWVLIRFGRCYENQVNIHAYEGDLCTMSNRTATAIRCRYLLHVGE